MLTAVLIVQKMYNDCYWGNKSIARVGGVQLEDLNTMEEQFLDIIDYDVYIKEDEYQLYQDKLKNFFEEPMEENKYRVIQNILAKMHYFDQLYSSQRINLLTLPQPPLKLHALYSSFLEDQMKVAHMMTATSTDFGIIRT